MASKQRINVSETSARGRPGGAGDPRLDNGLSPHETAKSRTPTFEVRLLGAFAASRDGEPLLALRTARLQSLFAYLVLHRETACSRKHLAFLIWPDSSEEHAQTNLRKQLFDLRHALPDPDQLLVSGAQDIRWNSQTPVTLDVDEFVSRAKKADSIEDLQGAADLYQGDLLPSCYDEWIAEERERLRRLYVQALGGLAELLEIQGDYQKAIAYARRQLPCEPLDEANYRRLMRLSALCGNRARVAWFYKTCAFVLERELGIEPSAETREIYLRSLDSAAQHRAAQAKPPGPPGAGLRPSNLPFQLTRIIGRERERADVQRLMLGNRLLTLTGPPGVGKTRLAVQAANDMRERFSSGVCYVDLAPMRDPKQVVPGVAHMLGLKEMSGVPISRILEEYLREKELLLVLDNFEHLEDAAGAVWELLAGCPRLRVLVTSRIPLRLSGEHEYRVSPLPLPSRDRSGALIDKERLAQFESVRLFMERAQSVMPAFKLDSTNAQAVAEICIHLDGIPLAIELASARTRIFSPQALLGRLERSMQVLSGRARDLPPRHRTLHSAIEWSYGLLTMDEARLFTRLAIFNGGARLEAVEAVCNFDGMLQIDVLEGLEALTEQSLLEQHVCRDQEPRFRMLETIRSYAREKLAECEEGDILAREHARYFLSLAEEAEPNLLSAGQVKWFDLLEDEHDNLLAALHWALERASKSGGELKDNEGSLEALEIGLRIAAAINRFWYTKGYYTEGREQIEKLLAVAGDLDVSGAADAISPGMQNICKARAKALRAAGWLAHSQGDHATASSLLEESLALNRHLDNKIGAADCLIAAGTVALDVGDYDRARAANEESLALSRETGYQWGIARSLLCLGNLSWRKGDRRQARALYEEGLAIAEEIGDKSGVGVLLYVLAILAFAEGDYPRARQLFEQSLAISRELGFMSSIAIALRNLAGLALIKGDYARAHAQYEDSLANCLQTGDRLGVAAALQGMGAVAAECGQAQRGTRLLGAGEAIMEAASHHLPEDESLIYDRCKASVCRQLPQDEFQQALVEGRGMGMEQAIDYALQWTPLGPGAGG